MAASAQVGTYLDVHGTRVYLQRKGQGPPLLVLHGEDAASRWRAFHDRLAERFDLLLPDHPGFGHSDLPSWLEGVPDLVYHYLDVLDVLGLDRVYLLGESFGGWLAAELATAHSQRLAGLVLIAPFGLRAQGAPVPDLFMLNREQLAAASVVDSRVAAELAAPPPSREALERHLQDRATLSRLAWNPYLHNPQLQHWLRRVTVPTLLVWGREDRLVPLETAQLWLERLPSARLATIDRAGHLPQVEHADRTADLVLEFLQRGG